MYIFCSFRCRKSGWPVCGPKCEKRIEHNPEVVIPHQTGRNIFNQIQYVNNKKCAPKMIFFYENFFKKDSDSF